MDFIPDISGRLMAIQSLASTLPSINEPSLFQQRLNQILSYLRFFKGEHTAKVENIKNKVVSLLSGVRTESSLTELIGEINAIRSKQMSNIDGRESKPRTDIQLGDRINYDEHDRKCIVAFYPVVRLFRSVIEQIEMGMLSKSMLEAYEMQSDTFSMYLPIVAVLYSLSRKLNDCGLCIDPQQYENLTASWRSLCIPEQMLPFLVEYFVRDEKDFAKYSEEIPADFRSIILEHKYLWKRIYKEGSSHLDKSSKFAERDMYHSMYPRILSIASKPIQEDERLCSFAHSKIEEEPMTLDQARALFENQVQLFTLTPYIPILQLLILKYLKVAEHHLNNIRSWLDTSNAATHVPHAVLMGTILNADAQIDVKQLIGFIADIDEMCLNEGWRNSCYEVLYLSVCSKPPFEEISALTDLVPYTFRNGVKIISYTARLKKEIQENGGDCNIIFKYLSLIPESIRCQVLTSLTGTIVKYDITIAYDLLLQLHHLDGFEKFAGVLIEIMGKTLSVYGRALSNMMVFIIQKTKGEKRTVIIQELINMFKVKRQPLEMIENLFQYLTEDKDKTSRVVTLTVVCVQALTEATSDDVLAVLKRLLRFKSDEPAVKNNLRDIGAQAFMLALQSENIPLQLRITNFRLELDPDNYEVMENNLVPLCMDPEINDYEKALSTIDACLKFTRNEEELQLQKARCLYILNRYAESLEITSKYVEKTQKFDLFFIHGKNLLRLDRLQEGLPFVLKVLEKQDDQMMLSYVAEYYFKENKNAEALVFIERLLNLKPELIDYCSLKLQALLKCKKFKEAFDFSFKVMERDPDNLDAAYAQYHFYIQSEEYKKALMVIEPFEAELERYKPSQKQNILVSLANVYYNLFEYDKALKVITRAQDIVPQHTSKLVDILHNLGRHEEALKILDIFLIQKPRDTEAYRMRGLIYLTSGSFEKSLLDMNRHFEFGGTKEYLNLLRVCLLIYLTRIPEALQKFESLNLTSGTLIKSHRALVAFVKGQVHFIKNEISAAKESLKESVEIYDADPATKKTIVPLYNRTKAKELLDKVELTKV